MSIPTNKEICRALLQFPGQSTLGIAHHEGRAKPLPVIALPMSQIRDIMPV
jgi:hypothetical protein